MKRRYKKEFAKAYNDIMRTSSISAQRFTTTAAELNKVKLAKKVLSGDTPSESDILFFDEAWDLSVMKYTLSLISLCGFTN